MKPDKPAPTGRDRDILRAHHARPLKTTGQTSSSSSSSSVATSLETAAARPESAAVPAADPVTAPGPSSGGEEGRGAEMKLYLDKLRELVPYVPRSGRISRVELIHSAIDYITDLQESLEARARRKLRDKQDQSSRPPLAALPQAHLEANTSRPTPLMENTTNRLPTTLETNTRHPAALAALEATSPPTPVDNSATSSSSSSTPIDLPAPVSSLHPS